jgi:hypothetical protein
VQDAQAGEVQGQDARWDHLSWRKLPGWELHPNLIHADLHPVLRQQVLWR